MPDEERGGMASGRSCTSQIQLESQGPWGSETELAANVTLHCQVRNSLTSSVVQSDCQANRMAALELNVGVTPQFMSLVQDSVPLIIQMVSDLSH